MSEPAGLDDLNGLLIGVCARNLLLLFLEVQHLLRCSSPEGREWGKLRKCMLTVIVGRYL